MATLSICVLAGGVAVWLWGRSAADPGQGALATGAVQGLTGAGPRDRPASVEPSWRVRSAAISGTIRDPDQQPIVGARVCALAGGHRLARADLQPVCVESKRDGRYRIEGLLAVRHRVHAMAPRFVPVAYVRGEGVRRRDTVDLRPGQEASGVDMTLEAGGIEIHGVVQDVSGGAIEGARVNGGMGAGIGITTSGPDGGFSLWVRPGRVMLWSDTDGYAQASTEGAAPGHRFELFLTPESVVIGKVMCVGDGSPVADAEVWVERGDSISMTFSGGGGGSAIADGGGNFRIDGLAPGAYKARAQSDDAIGVAAEQVVLGLGETSEPIVIHAHPAFHAEGYVIIDGGDACIDGSVYLRDAAKDREGWGEPGPNGGVRVRGLLPGTYEVSPSCPGHLLADSYPPVVIGAANVTGLRWEVQRGRAIRGVIIDARGRPAAGLDVGAFSKEDSSQPRTRQSTASHQSDEHGRFELAGLLPGEYRVTVSASRTPRAVPAEPLDVVIPDGRDVDDLRIELPAAGEIRGSVRDARGQPVAQVQLQLLGDGRGNQTMSSVDDGSFHFPEVAAGAYRLIVLRAAQRLREPDGSDDEPVERKLEVKSGGVETVNLVVEGPAGKITGVVHDEGGAIVVDAFVEASREPESEASATGEGARARWRGAFDRPRLTDADGRFTINELLPGKYAVRAQRRGGGEALVEHVALGDSVSLTIEATGRVAGMVRLASGGAPEQFSATIWDRRTGFRRDDSFFRTNGTWSFGEVPQGSYELAVHAPEGTQKLSVTLAAGEVREGLRIELAGVVKLRGTVVDLDGAPVPNVEVKVSADGSVRLGQNEADRRHISDAAGHFEIDLAPVGVVSLVAAPPPRGEYDMVWSTVKIAGGQDEVTLPPIHLAKRRVAVDAPPGDLGFAIKRVQPMDDPLMRRLIVAIVRPGGPAAGAGLQVGDEIVAIDGHDVTGPNAYLQDTLLKLPEGVGVRLGLARGVTLEITAGSSL